MTKLKTCVIESTLPTIEVKLFHDEAKYLKALEKQNVVVEVCSSPAEVCTTEIKDGTIVSFVLIRDALTHRYEQQLALLCHEAVHIAQDYFDNIGEIDPATEEQAYVIQSIFQCLAIEHRKWINKRSKV